MRNRGWCVVLLICCSIVATSHPSLVAGELPPGGWVLTLPLPPDPSAIGTAVGSVNTYVESVTVSPPAAMHRLGLNYTEMRGVISGIGWGGSNGSALFQCHYAYALPYVLRIPAGWDGGLVVFRHQVAPLAEWEFYESFYGDTNWARVSHESADRYASDVALHPARRWAFFAVNQNPVSAGGGHNTLFVGDGGCAAGAPTQSERDIPIGRDLARVGQRLLSVLRGVEPTMTLGVGFATGAAYNFMLNAGVDLRGVAGAALQTGDNFRVPYVPSSGRIYDGFLSVDGVTLPQVQTADLNDLSAPTIFLIGEANRQVRFLVAQLSNVAANATINGGALTRFYSVRNVPAMNTDFTLSMLRPGIDWVDGTGYYEGGGEQIRPLTAAMLDALARWTRQGIAPPVSVFNGEVFADHMEFYRTSAPVTAIPYVDDTSIDTYTQPAPIVPAPILRLRFTAVRDMLGAPVGSIVLPETACRRGGFNFREGGGVWDTFFVPFLEPVFLQRWGSAAAYQSCVVQTIDALTTAGFYDPRSVPIDVDPEHSPNVIDPTSTGRLAVAIFSTAAFDATQVVPGSLRLASVSAQGEAASPSDLQQEITDVNGDGRPDLIVRFRIDRLRLIPSDLIVDLWGITRNGLPFAGSDLVRFVR